MRCLIISALAFEWALRDTKNTMIDSTLGDPIVKATLYIRPRQQSSTPKLQTYPNPANTLPLQRASHPTEPKITNVFRSLGNTSSERYAVLHNSVGSGHQR
jgi:hypothetical protein